VSDDAGRPIEHGPRDRDAVALTFDADVSRRLPRSGAAARAGAHRKILAFLKSQRVPATLFLTGLWVEVHPSDAREVGREPLFEIGNHSYSHLAFAGPCFGLPVINSDGQKREEVLRGADVIAAATRRMPRYFRFPGGCYAPGDVALVRTLRAEPVQWDVLSGDSFDFDAASVAQRILESIRPGSIVVMHLSEPQRAVGTEVLTILLPELHARGLTPVTLSDLLGAARRSQLGVQRGTRGA
jgi:peptidoglycan/xylan/chitin deacetylase (PgdA/CDA1 family)